MTPQAQRLLPTALALVLLLVALQQLGAAGTSSLLIAVVLSAMSLATVVHRSTRGWASVSSLYALVFGLFHLGLLVPVALGWQPRLFNAADSSWFYSPALLHAAQLLAVGSASLAVGHSLGRGTSRQASDVRGSSHTGLALVGGGLVVLSVGAWFATALGRGGAALLASGYETWLAATSGSATPWIYLGMGLGMPLAAASSHPTVGRISLVSFLAFALPGLFIGLRGEVLLPGLAYVVVVARQQILPFRLRYVAYGVGALALGSLIRTGRQEGIRGGNWPLSALDPVSGLAELGYTIRPLLHAWQWHGQWDEPFVGWGTYTATAERLLLGTVLGLPVTPVGEDPSVFSSTVLDRIGPIGGSPVAEAFRANGVVAVVVVMGTLGLCLALLDRLPLSAMHNAVVGGVAFVLFLWIRNDVTPVLVNLAALAGFLAAAAVIEMGARGRPLPDSPRWRVGVGG